ncbi:phage holin [Amphibacillus sp. Q70]|uniref:phage holin n=1 Tax=Amphibacillus sp. Q70 TaxID=3453416 RepID=UPI003F83FB09
MNIKNVDKSVWVRVIALFLVLANQISVSFLDFKLLPFAEEEIYEGVSIVVTTLVTLWASWKNNSFTDEAQEADVYLAEQKSKKKFKKKLK